MRVAVLGSGNGGCAAAFDFASQGHSVTVFDFEAFPTNIRAIQEQGGIYSEGALEGFAAVDYAGHDMAAALEGADLVLPVGPAFSTRPFAEACAGLLEPGQIVLVCPSSCGGALEFKIGAGLDVQDDQILVAETSTLPYAVRMTGPGRIQLILRLPDGVLLAALPGRCTARVLEALAPAYPMLRQGRNVLQTSLQNANPVLHPAITLLNTASVERLGGSFLFYEHGVTPAVGRLLKAVDRERIQIGASLGLEIVSDPELGVAQGYMKESSYDRGYSEAPGFQGIKAFPSLDNRYLNEDVGFGLVFMEELARQLGVPTPSISAIVHLTSVVMNRDYRSDASRTMASLGLAGLDAEDLLELVD